ncbi:MAG: ABC transporter permease [Desulforhopalus sp.]|nr:ABC transporter permease [Desulforhopalus sp.]
MKTPQLVNRLLFSKIFTALWIIALAAGAVSLLLLALGIAPGTIVTTIGKGSVASWQKFSHVLSVWIPLLLCSCCLLFTFRAGLWNIGVEGQMILGAIATTAILRLGDLGLPPMLTLSLALAMGFVGGGLWGGLAGLLKNRGGVNEIFGGLGLNFVAQGLIIWLIMGPWKRAGIASMSGTDMFARELWMYTPPGWRFAPAALAIALCAFAATALILGATRFGLRITATGNNPMAAPLFAIRPERTGLAAMAIGGGLAGLAGGLQVACVYHRLLPPISSGYGYLALLVVMLANYRTSPVPIICLFFAGLAAGSIQLPIVLQLDSALSGVIQGACVVSALLVHGLQKRQRGAS